MASRLLGDLGRALGGRLFERTARGLAPTGTGEVLIRRAGAALAQMDGALREISVVSPGPVWDSHAQGGGVRPPGVESTAARWRHY
ncbi:LysR family transcriptional regulator [Pseudoduganella namucuonensis]|uniref:LysR family transcriptional regulator n=1 Tax=Pseudoduganella namucuonensis TaxID=1035707 RepID=UPI0015A5E50B|nr:LysR family transcriptional regulator [Pseudoduganella namucuonensis]